MERTADRGGPDSDHRRGPGPRRTLTAIDNKEWVLADGAGVHGDGTDMGAQE